MTSLWKSLVVSGLVLAVLGAAIYFPILRRRVKRAARLQQQSEEQARRELAQPIVVNPSDPRVKTKLFWASDAMDSTLTAVVVELPLASDPVLRSMHFASLFKPVCTTVHEFGGVADPPDDAVHWK